MNRALITHFVVFAMLATAGVTADSVDCGEPDVLPLSMQDVGPAVRKGEDLGLDEYTIDVPVEVNEHILAEVRLSLYQSEELVLDSYLRQYRFESDPNRVRVTLLLADTLLPFAKLTFDYLSPGSCPGVQRYELDLDDIDVP